MKELVFVLPDKNGGIASVVYNILKFYTGKCSTTVLLLQAAEDDKYKNTITYPFPCDKQIVIRYKLSDAIYKVYNLIAKHLHENSILISNDGNLELGTVYFKRISIPVVYILHGSMDYYFSIMKKYEKIIDQVICVSSYVSQRIKDENINLTSSFIPFPLPSVPQFEKLYFSSQLRITYVGTLGDHKGVKYFPEYIEELNRLGVNYFFDIIGNGDNESFLKDKFSNNCNVKIHGLLPQEETFHLLKNAHILILFSKGEGLPVCVVEAMKHGTLPIVFDIPSGVPDIIDSGKNGFIVPQGEVIKAAKITKELFDDRVLLQKLGQSGKKKAELMFDPIKQANAYVEVFFSTTLKMKEYRIKLKTMLANYIPCWLLYRFMILK